ncbi:MAG: cache domain-containing protein [Deltaproteobacteria bacterium]|nr:cache domain-containing protein [Deltaproteobacteria bacterium]MBW2122624.1 cache domain-containing protein [Deltaproteobacteria bacterium]
MKTTLKAQLIRRFVAVVCITGVVSSLVGTLLLNKWTVGQAEEHVKNSLNAAREILNSRLEIISTVIYLSSVANTLKEALSERDRQLLLKYLQHMRVKWDMDILTITDEDGTVLLRARNPNALGDSVASNRIIRRVLSTRKQVSSVEIVPYEELEREGKDIALRCQTKLVETPKAKPVKRPEVRSGMVLMSASPIFDKKRSLTGVLYGGVILNRNYQIVDKIRDIVYHNEEYRGKQVGTATIFLKDFRISTNVENTDGSRAIGTRVSEEVYERVLERGERWAGRAFVVNDWYVSAYEPIRDFSNRIIGMLSVAVLGQKFADMRKETLIIFFGITAFGMVLSLVIANFLSDAMVRPIKRLVEVAHRISQGDFSVKVESRSANELSELETAFDVMGSSLQERDEEIRKLTEQHMMRSEKLSSIGRLAAGIAHEINNPLTSVLTFSSLLLRKAPDDQKERLGIIVQETTRCREIVKNLLNFARQSEPKKELSNLNQIIEAAFSLIKNQLYVNERRIDVVKELACLPEIHIDPNQMLEVFVNIMINAVDAMPEGGTLRVTTGVSEDGAFVEARVSDTGIGIPEENINDIFDPFFTTKEAGKGTGLGLAVAYGIVERHKGRIDVESEVNKGTTFIIKLPVE